MNSKIKNFRESVLLQTVKIGLLVMMLAIVIVIASAQAQNAKADVVATVGPNCRYGASSWTATDHPFMEQMNMGWTLDFGSNPGKTLPSGIEYTPMIRLDGFNESPPYYMRVPATEAALINQVKANPGQLWMIGNEVDRIYWQDQMYPEQYAEAYYNLYHLIKKHDPSAQISISGLVEVTPGRLQYLDLVWDAYLDKYGVPMPVDVWNMHIYVLPEAKYENGKLVGSRAGVALGTDISLAKLESDGTPNQCHLDQVYCNAEHDSIDIFKQQVVSMRQWMKDHGQQNKPLILSEFSTLLGYDGGPDGACFEMDENGKCFNPERVNKFMRATFDYMEYTSDANLGYPKDNNRLVQQWLWFTMSDPNPESSNRLIKENGGVWSLTERGVAFRDYTSAKPLNNNLFSDQNLVTIVAKDTPAAPLSFEIRNNGNTATTKSIKVTFYSDAARTQPIGSPVVVPAGIGGCARTTVTVPSVEWSGLKQGVNWFWAVIDSDNALGADEPNKNDNIVTGYVLYNPEQVFLPAISN